MAEEQAQRGVTLSIFAILFGLLAISNFLKPLHLDPDAAFVFLGTKMTGTANTTLSILFGILLAVYGYGIWTMRKIALVIAYLYFPWVVVNMILYTAKNPDAPPPALLVSVASVVVGIGVPLATIMILHGRRAELD